MTKLKLMGWLVAAGAAAAGAAWPAATVLPGVIAQAPADPPRAADPLEARMRRLEDRLNKLEGRAGGGAAGATTPAPVSPAPDSVVAFLAGRFKYKVPFETGQTQSNEGGRLEITDVWGTRPKIEIGGQYVVRGRYVLPSSEDGTLYFHETASRVEDGTSYEMDLQHTTVAKGHGEFMLMHGMTVPGSFHLSLTGSSQGKSVWYADQYFGTGDNVYRKK